MTSTLLKVDTVSGGFTELVTDARMKILDAAFGVFHTIEPLLGRSVAMATHGPVVPTVLYSSATINGSPPPFVYQFILCVIPTDHRSPSNGAVK